MATTEDQLIGFVLDNFAATGTGQSPTTEDLEKVRPYLAGALADLSTRDVIYIPDADSVPDAAVHWVAAIIAQTPGLRRHFGDPADVPTVAFCEARLRQQAPPKTYETLQAVYY